MRLTAFRCSTTETAPLLHRRGRRLWTPEADAFLQRHARCCSSAKLAGCLGVTRPAIRNRLSGLWKRSGGFTRCRWSPSEDGRLRRLAGTVRLAELVEDLGRTANAIKVRAGKLGVSVLPAWGWSDGYRVKRTGSGKRRLQHREVMAEALGRSLENAELVHHINLVKDDNRPENLHVCRGNGAHLRTHRSLERLVPALLELGVIEFDRIAGVYQLSGPASR